MTEFLLEERTRNVLYLLLIGFCMLEGFLLHKRLSSAPRTDAQAPAALKSLPDRLAALGTHPLTWLTVALTLGGALRFYGLDFGLPNAYHPDELQKANFLRKMMSAHRLDPHFSLQPPLLLYLSWIVSNTLEWLQLFTENTIVRNLFAGRFVNACFGTFSIYLVYAIGKRISAPFTGAFAALLLAVFPLHVTNSRYMKEDALFLTFVLACVLAVLKFVDEKKLRYLYLAGLLAGFAFGSKYTGIVSFAIVLMAAWLPREKFSFIPNWRVLGHACCALLFMALGFLLTVPYVFGNFEGLRQIFEGFGAESRHAMRGHLGLVIDPWSQLWMYHFSRSILPGVQLVPALAALLGAGYALRKWEPKLLWIVALMFMFYLPAEWARSKPPPQPDRYVLACVPFMAILAAELVRQLSFHIRTTTVAALCVAFLAFPLTRTLFLASELRDDTRKQMTEWMAENLPPGSRILLAGGTTYLPRVPMKFKADSARKFVGRDKTHIARSLRDSGYDYFLTTSFNDGRFSVDTGKDSRVRDAFKRIDKAFPLAAQAKPKWGSYGFHNPTISLYSLKQSKGAEQPSESAAAEATTESGS
ncbi:MAG: glycosyltransferase family 39 protein [Bdellovibrionota bacterium]